MAHRLGPVVTVQPMIDDGVEISVGVVRDPAFGPLLVVAAGGTLVELLDDRVVALPPLSRAGRYDSSTECGSGRCWPAGVAPHRST